MGAVDTTYTFTATDTITSSKMNNIIDQTTITTDAIIGTTLDVASGKLKIRSSGITSNEMGANSVTTNSITDLSVTTGKVADLAITTGKLANLSVTTGKLADDAITTVKVLDSNITPAKLSQPLTLATAQSSTSGTSIDFTSIPSWVKKITITFSGVSTNGSSGKRVRLGTSSGFVSTGYLGVDANISSGAAASSITDGFGLRSFSAADILHGIVTIVKVSGNTWAANGSIAYSNVANITFLSGSITLADVLTQVRITTINGTDTFDAGLINIMYE